MNSITSEVPFGPVKKEVHISICHGCLSTDRCLRPLGSYEELFTTLLAQQIPQLHAQDIASTLLCWECRGVLRKVQTFMTNVLQAQILLKQTTYHDLLPSLSTLTVAEVDTDYSIKYEEDKDTNLILKMISDDVIVKRTSKQNELDLEVKDLKEECFEDDFPTEDNTVDDQEDYADVKDFIDFSTQENSNEKHYVNTEETTQVPKLKNRIRKPSKILTCVRKFAELTDNPIEFKNLKNYFTVSMNLEEINKFVEKEKKTSERSTSTHRKICKICQSRFKYTIDLCRHRTFEHLIKSHNGPFQCLACRQECPDISSLTTHWQEQHSEVVLYKCMLCREVMRDNKRRRHLNLHTKTYTCKECQFKCYLYKDFQQHYKDLHKIFKCDLCGKARSSKHKLIKHLRGNHMPFKCELCAMVFTRLSTLRAHQERKHNIQVYPDQGMENSYCVECDRQFPTRYQYQYHLKKHTAHKQKKEQQVSCAVCNKIFSRKCYWKNHYNQVHATSPTKYYCAICDKRFSTGYSHRLHQKRVHDKQPLPKDKMCDICGRGFSTNRVLINHRRTHTGERPFACPRCPAAFAQSSALVTHARNQHKMTDLTYKEATEKYKRNVEV